MSKAITFVPREEVLSVWGIVAPMIERALDYNEGRADQADVLAGILTDQKGLWLAFDTETKEIVGCCVTVVYDAFKLRIMAFEYLAGEDVDTWLDEGAEVLNKYAYDQKCQLMEFRGRFGWIPRMKKYGWEQKAVFFERKVEAPADAPVKEKEST